ncbi:MAG: hypothetical protein GX596_14100 [Propionibacterium sp.]|nr:hypothetical protein [Propionibacterium sp.]
MFSIIHPWLAVAGMLAGVVLGILGMRRSYRAWLRAVGDSAPRVRLRIIIWSLALLVVVGGELALLFEAYMRFPTVTAIGSALVVLVLTALIVPFVPRGLHRPGWPSVRRALEREGATADVARTLAWGAWIPFVLSLPAVLYPVGMLLSFYDVI